jgi:hypothetical protein
VTPKKDFSKKSHQTQSDTFNASEDEDTDSNNALLAHLVWDVLEVNFDDEAPRKWQENKRKNWFPNEMIVLE